MAKDPAFLFYPGDWMGGTITFTRAHKGAYMDLLMAQFNGGHLTLDDVKMILGNDFDFMWEQKLKSKFKVDSNGCFYNVRLEEEKDKRKSYTQSRRNNLSGISDVGNTHMVHHMGKHMENENENINTIKKRVPKTKESTSKKYRFKAPDIFEVEAYFRENGYKPEVGQTAFEYYRIANWHDSKGSPVKNWKQKMHSVWFKEENKSVGVAEKRLKKPSEFDTDELYLAYCKKENIKPEI